MRLGLFGGRFDPVHIGHLIVAETARERLELDELWFVPAKAPPHKPTVASPERRLEMVRLAVEGNPSFRVSELELERPGTSYTIDTLERVRAEMPRATLFFVTGMDAVRELGDWRRPRAVVECAHVVALPRLGATLDGLAPELRRRVRVLEAPLIEVSGSGIRSRRRQGRSVRYLVPESVERYLAATDLYAR